MPSEPPRSLNVLISGAGIAGPATAFWLSRLGHKCTIVERFPGIRENGLQIDIRKEGVEAVRRMGLLDEVRKHVVDELGTKFVDSSGRCIALFPRIEADKRGRQGFTSEYEIMRHDLVRVLVAASRDAVTYRFNLSVAAFDDRADAVVVTFSDGTVESYDLLVGADGHGSRIRKMLQRSERAADASVDMGVYMCFFTTPPSTAMEKMTNFYLATRRRVLATRLAADGQVYMAVRGPPGELAAVLARGGDAPAQKRCFAAVFRDAGWRAEELVAAMHAADDFYATSTHVVRSAAWSGRRVVLVGDAGYAPTPLTGAGTSLALIGATILAGEVAAHGPDRLPAAFAAYERTLRPYVDVVQDIPRSVTHGPFCEGRVKLRLVQLLLCAMTKLRLDKLFQSFILRSNDSFRIPQYPELDKVVGSQA